jgi:pimeloyl-ACP methyl ester carboxylesterase
MNTSIQTLQGSTRLAFDSVEGVTNTVERMHKTIARQAMPWARQLSDTIPSHGIVASAVYSAIRGVNGVLREGVDRSLGLMANAVGVPQLSDAEIRMVAAINGVCGDHLEATGNALALPMVLMTPERPLRLESGVLARSLPQPSPHLVILVHGLCLSELSWTRGGAPCIGSRLREELGLTPLYLRYNTGRHISTNGQAFAELLERVCDAWPVPVESVSVIGHSMGGLVTRSACWYAEQAGHAWLQRLDSVVFLGTPHHGSFLEKAGHAWDRAMQKIPYTEPLAVGRWRSAGIKDLRHGNLLEEDLQGDDHGPRRRDNRRVVPLLPDVDYFFAAATLGTDQRDPIGYLLGDMLVRLDSAVGSHRDVLRRLEIDPTKCRVFYEKTHFDLLDDERVHRQIVEWFRSG